MSSVVKKDITWIWARKKKIPKKIQRPEAIGGFAEDMIETVYEKHNDSMLNYVIKGWDERGCEMVY